MKQSVLTFVAILLTASACFSTPCIPASLTSYIALGSTGCDAGVVTFSGFQLESGIAGSIPLNPSSVQVTPGGSLNGPTLTLTTNTSATAPDFIDLLIRFRAAGSMLSTTSVTLNQPSFTGDGAVIGILDVCPGAMFSGGTPVGCPSSPGSAVAAVSDGGSFPSDSIISPISSFFDVFAEITIDGGLSGTASLPSAAVRISAVPEPSTTLLLPFVLLAGARAVRRRRAR